MQNGILRLRSFVGGDRHAAITAAASAITACGGWVVEHTLFSDIMAVINFQLPAGEVASLADRLGSAGIPVSPPAPAGTGAAELVGQLVLIFPNGTGNLRHTVPAFS